MKKVLVLGALAFVLVLTGCGEKEITKKKNTAEELNKGGYIYERSDETHVLKFDIFNEERGEVYDYHEIRKEGKNEHISKTNYEVKMNIDSYDVVIYGDFDMYGNIMGVDFIFKGRKIEGSRQYEKISDRELEKYIKESELEEYQSR